MYVNYTDSNITFKYNCLSWLFYKISKPQKTILSNLLQSETAFFTKFHNRVILYFFIKFYIRRFLPNFLHFLINWQYLYNKIKILIFGKNT